MPHIKDTLDPHAPFEHENAVDLTLDPKHPGLHDAQYVMRRKELFQLAREWRLKNQGFPQIEYRPEEHALWRTIVEKLTPVHAEKACQSYLTGLKNLKIDSRGVPNFASISDRLWREYSIGLAPAEGLLSTSSFYSYLWQRRMPCTLFLRHPAHPEYTPEPDAVHDFIGHVPLLTHPDYADIIELIGVGVRHATPEQLTAWARIYWFTIEFSLIEEAGDIKVFGAGLLSSYGEMLYAYSDNVKRKEFNLTEIIETDYDNTRMQDVLFVIPSIAVLRKEIIGLLKNYAA